MKRVIALSLMLCAAYAEEPEPEGYTTSMEPESDMSTTVETGPKHEIIMSAPLPNLANFTDTADLISKLKTEVMKSVTDSNADVQVEITHLKVVASYGGFTEEIQQSHANAIIDSVVAMYAGLTPAQTVAPANIKVNNFSYTSGGRLLQAQEYTAQVETTIPNTGSGDAVQKAQALVAGNTASNLIAQLSSNPAAPTGTATLPNPPETKIAIKTTIKGTHSTPPKLDLATNVGALLGGTVDVQVESSGVTTTVADETESDNRAPIAPIMTIWAALYAFVMS